MRRGCLFYLEDITSGYNCGRLGPGQEVLMELTSAQRTEIDKLASGIQCPKDFECYKSKAGKMCKTRDFGLERYLDCLEDEQHACEFSLSFGAGYFCTCPVQIYIAKHLKQ